MNYRDLTKVILLLLFCGCIFYLIRSRCSAEKSILADDELRTAGDSLIALSVPQPLKYIKYVGSRLCVVRDTVKKENGLYRIGDEGMIMSLYNCYLDSIPGTREYLFFRKNKKRYFLDAETLKESAAICFSDFNVEYGLGQSKRNGFLALGYSNSGRFRYLVNSKGSGCYLWGINKVQACYGKLEFSLGIKPCSFSMDRSFKELDSVYVPYPAETRLIQQEYTVEREGETYVRLCMNLTYPISGLGKNRWLKDWISSAVKRYIAPLADDTKRYHGDDPVALCDRYSRCYIDSYNEECPWSDRELWFHWERQFLLSLQWKWGGGRYLTFYVANDGYYGGIHGMYTREYISLDLQKKKVLTFDDLIKPEKRLYVRNILLAKMKADFCKGYEPMTDAKYLLHLNSEYVIQSKFKDMESKEAVEYMKANFPLNDPAITPEGLVFYYAPYEIDCFAAGNKFFVLAYQELKDCMAIEL